MRGKRSWIGAVCGLCLSAACSGDGTSPPAARDPNFPAGPTAAVPSGAAGAIASGSRDGLQPSAADAPALTPPIGAQTPKAAKPYEGLPIGPSAPPVDNGQTNFIKNVPTDERAVTTVNELPPISGGTLAVTADDRYAVASDPDRDRVSIVDLSARRLVGTIALTTGDEPGRVAIDSAGRAHVALRRGGAIVSIDTTTQTLLERRQVCAAPRGIEYDATRQRLFVACQSGELVSLPVSGTDSITRQLIASDLRDVLPRPNGVFVSRFKSAELLALGADGAVQATAQPGVLHKLFAETDGSQSVDALDPLGARRIRLASDGSVMMLHQTAREGDISLEPEGEAANPMISGSPYGGAGQCSGVAGIAITTFDTNGTATSTIQLGMGTLAVDLARSPLNREIAIATAGAPDPYQPSVSFQQVGSLPAGSQVPPQVPATTPPPTDSVDLTNQVMGVLRFQPSLAADPTSISGQTPGALFGAPLGAPPCMGPSSIVGLPGPATAVAYLADERLLVQTREPAAVFIAPAIGMDTTGALPARIDLGGPSVLDTGHEIFHRDAGAGVACATCHLEGEEDGHTWHFAGQGPRRTQALSVGLEGTAPFHWVGDMTDLGKLMESVFVGRMGGVHQAPARLDALARWMFSIQAPAPLRAASDPAVARGHELFVGASECSKCHEGPKLTNNQTVDVGTGLALQVPSLVGVGLRGPWLHTGCAKTLQQRFDPACGGNAHGTTAGLTAAQVDDLVAYLESL